jgi:3-deoxy-7-phosphoheptulonate synthase
MDEKRRIAEQIVLGKGPRIALIVGPCSIHDPKAALEYAGKLAQLQSQVADTFFIVMRVFFEKPRTRFGWKGFIYDPFLDESFQMKEGLIQARKLLIQINQMGVPCATEFLHPLVFHHIQDQITWGVIGARTSSSPIHRELAALAHFPIGFKNDLSGNLEPAIDGILTASAAQSHFHLDKAGAIKPLFSQGNPHTHLILRGSKTSPNLDPASINQAHQTLLQEGIQTKIIVDCSHGNSNKDPQNQKTAFRSVISQLKNNSPICGLMLESFLHEGSQPISHNLRYGVSITDACLSWKDSEELILEMHEKLQVCYTEK